MPFFKSADFAEINPFYLGLFIALFAGILPTIS